MKSAYEDGPSAGVVVLAEDEPLIRMIAADALGEAGFEVIEAGHAAEALAILISNATDIHVLFTDIHMPGAMDGLELAHHSRAHWPWIALLIASGKVMPGVLELPVGSRFIPKPYDCDHVVTHIRELMAAR